MNAQIGITQDEPYDHSSHEIFTGLAKNNTLYADHSFFPLQGAGWKEDHNCKWDFNAEAYGLEDTPNKLANFARSMESVGKSLAKASNAFTTAKKQLSEGTGNAVRTAERLCSQLGLKPKLRIADAMPDADAAVIDAEAEDAETAAAIAAAGADEPPADGDGASA